MCFGPATSSRPCRRRRSTTRTGCGCVPEVRDRLVGILVCAADPGALDRLVAPGHGARTLRVAPDETMAVVSPEFTEDVRRERGDRVAALDPDALVVDVSDGWA